MKLKYILPILTGVLITISSCHKDEYLNPVPPTSTQDADAFNDGDRILNQVRALYLQTKNGNFLGGRYLIYNDIRADNFINAQTNGVTGLTTWNFTVGNSAQEITGSWQQAYLAINYCNLFLDGMVAKGNSVVGATLAANYNSEAKFLRALCYYELLQLYARPYWDGNGSKNGLPLRLTGNKAPGDYKLARSTVDQVYQQVIKDLNEAETGLPLTYSSALLNTTRAHRNTAIALKTRVYLSMRKYPEVITEANKIVTTAAPFKATTGVADSLQSDITAVFKTPYTTTESILSFPFQTGADVPGTQNQLGYYYGTPQFVSGSNSEYYLNTAGVIADPNWTATDKRKSFIGTSTTAGSTLGRKYLIKFPTASPFTDYAPSLRYSEVLLSLSEAIVRSTNTIDPRAVALLNAVRNRSDASTTYTVGSFASTTALLDALLQERNIEFLGEGLRSPDLLRLGLTIPGKSNVAAVPATDSRYIWPISSTELLNNTLCVDN